MKIQLEKIKGEIIGLQPVYTETGNATIIYLRQGEVADSRGIQAVKDALARTYAIDLAAQRKQMEQRLHRKVTMPFYLGAGRVFVPLKMRHPLASRDAVYGYVDVNCMGEVSVSKGDKNVCRLPLPDGRELEILSSRRLVEQSRAMGRSLLEVLQSERHDDAGEALVADVAVQFHRRLRVIERRLIHIETMIAEDESKYQSGRRLPIS